MKTAKKTLAILLAVMLVAALGASALAAGTGSITITPPANTPSNATNTYTIYKVFDADGNGSAISYKLVPGKTTAPTGFSVDAQGNVTHPGTATELTAAEIAAIAAYVTNADIVGTATSTGTAAATLGNLPNGYYYISTSTGAAVTVTSTNPNAQVNDKNTVPEHKKEITGTEAQYGSFDAAGKNAIAQVGKKVEFTQTITVGKGAKDYILHDTMTSGLTYDPSSLVVTNAPGYTTTPTATGDTLTVYLPNNLAEGTVVTIKYSATVNSAALTTDFEKNTAKLQYGNNPTPTYTPEQEVKVYDAKITAVKRSGSTTGPALAGAGFVLKNSSNAYYKLDNGTVTWVTDIAQADEHISTASGEVPAFTGLANGSYTLVEKTVPSGYNKAADTPLTIKDASQNNLTTELTVSPAGPIVNMQGAVLPTTGGVGTTIFYVLGSCLLLGAAVLMITRKRMGREG